MTIIAGAIAATLAAGAAAASADSDSPSATASNTVGTFYGNNLQIPVTFAVPANQIPVTAAVPANQIPVTAVPVTTWRMGIPVLGTWAPGLRVTSH
ncbi:hypothetical protein [Nonomuraea sp. SYSU D8015]|uniref:hypothetical protein n=1 Tax=Nonomuraea sp. SYSU D8015 TaxID=2593644 RepID=UPI001660CA02|nr:hypothetical protein [Nonomuraea sp. SYSU D8015]